MECIKWLLLVTLLASIEPSFGIIPQHGASSEAVEVVHPVPTPCPLNYTTSRDFSCVAIQASCAPINCSASQQQGQQQIQSAVGVQSINEVQTELLNRIHRLYFPRPRQAFAIQPKSYNPQPSCSRGFQWDGENCMQTVALEAKCPDDYSLSDGRCIHTVTGTCPAGFALINAVCVGDVEHQAECPDTYSWNGVHCVHTMDACPSGYNLTDGICQRAIIGFCPVGSSRKDSKCIQQSVQNVQCDDGYTWTGDKCVQYSSVCDSGYRLVSNRCEKMVISDEVPWLACSDGFQLRNGECVSTEFVCPAGFALDAEAKNCVEQWPACPDGYEYNATSSVCQQTMAEAHSAPRPVCPESFEIRGFYCQHHRQKQLLVWPICPNGRPPALNGSTCVSDEQSIDTSIVRPHCPHDFEFHNNTCRRRQNASQQLTVTPICPSGYHLSSSNNLCVFLIENVTPQCPINYAYNDSEGVCICNSSSNQLRTAPASCPDNFVLSHHICVQRQEQQQQQHPLGDIAHASCAPHYHFDGTTCAPAIATVATVAATSQAANVSLTSGIGTAPSAAAPACPFGFEWLNGTCHIIQPICPVGFSYYANACYRIYASSERQRAAGNHNNNDNNNAGPTREPAGHVTHHSTHNSPTNNGIGEILLEFSITNTINNNNTIYAPINVNITNRGTRVDVAAAAAAVPPTRAAATSIAGDNIDSNRNGIAAAVVTSGHLLDWTHRHGDDDDDDDADNPGDSQQNGIAATEEKCCEILSPRQCKLADNTNNSDDWICDHQKYRTCAEYCSQPKLYLRTRHVQYANAVLTMPPAPRRWWKVMNTKMLQLHGINCSGCIHGSYGCSNHCYYYDCDPASCSFLDVEQFCQQYESAASANICSHYV